MDAYLAGELEAAEVEDGADEHGLRADELQLQAFLATIAA